MSINDGDLKYDPDCLSNIDDGTSQPIWGATMSPSTYKSTPADVGIEPTKFFKRRQIFVEMDELREKLERNPLTHRFERTRLWVETHRWNFGLQEDLDEAGGMIWNHPHMPWCSAVGLVELQEVLTEDSVLLDVTGTTVKMVADHIVTHLEKCEVIDGATAAMLEGMMLLHSNHRRRTTSSSSLDEDWSAKMSPAGIKPARTRKPTQGSVPSFKEKAKDAEEFELLCPEELEEAADILIADCDTMDTDLVVFVRLQSPLDLRLERHARARFLVLVAGPPGDDAHERRVQIGEALAAMLQDEIVVEAAYTANNTESLFDAMAVRLNKLTVIPHMHRPTDEGVKKRLRQLRKQLTAASEIEDKRWVGGDWDVLAEDVFESGYTVGNALRFCDKYAIPLVLGIIAGVIVKNAAPDFYTNLEAGHHSDGDYGNITDSHDDDDGPPLLFDLTIAGHDVTPRFVVNDIFMTLHFAIAAEEITESFLPGAAMYPPTRAAINPLMATLGGVFGPILIFFVMVYAFQSGGAFDDVDYGYETTLPGWAIPTASDIPFTWMASLLTFGKGHPAINYLLLLAVVDDAIGIVIIAIFYPNPDHPVKLVWLLLVVIAMVLANVMNRLRVMDWRPYIAICGPIAWIGMLKSSLHPAVCLALIVPFIPHSTSEVTKKISDEAMLLDEFEDSPDIASREVDRQSIPLFKFEHSVKGWVDFFIMPLFGLVNAGVEFESIGPFTGIIFLSATVGKTLGIGLVAWLCQYLGFPAPKGMTVRSLFMCGYIASAGLTVSLFISDVAFSGNGAEGIIQTEAKLGVLLVMVNIPIAIAIGNTFHLDNALELKEKDVTESTFKTEDGDENSVHSDSDDDEFLEHVVAIGCVDRLRKIQSRVRDIEKETQMTREHHQKSLRERLHELQEDSTREESHVFEVAKRSLSTGQRYSISRQGSGNGNGNRVMEARRRSIAKLRARKEQPEIIEFPSQSHSPPLKLPDAPPEAGSDADGGLGQSSTV